MCVCRCVVCSCVSVPVLGRGKGWEEGTLCRAQCFFFLGGGGEFEKHVLYTHGIRYIFPFSFFLSSKNSIQQTDQKSSIADCGIALVRVDRKNKHIHSQPGQFCPGVGNEATIVDKVVERVVRKNGKRKIKK